MIALTFISLLAGVQAPQHSPPPTPKRENPAMKALISCEAVPAGGTAIDARRRPEAGSNADAAAYAARSAPHVPRSCDKVPK